MIDGWITAFFPYKKDQAAEGNLPVVVRVRLRAPVGFL